MTVSSLAPKAYSAKNTVINDDPILRGNKEILSICHIKLVCINLKHFFYVPNVSSALVTITDVLELCW